MGATSEPSLSSLAETFQVTLDTSPLHQFLLAISKQVEGSRNEFAALRAEVIALRGAQRLDTLELAVQSLADMQQPVSSFSGGSWGQSREASSSYAMAASRQQQQDGASVSSEVQTLKERMALMERKSEALWHEQGEVAEMKGIMERLKNDLESTNTRLADVASASHRTDLRADGAEEFGNNHDAQLRELKRKINDIVAVAENSKVANQELAQKTEHKVIQAVGQIKQLEYSMNLRVAETEASQASMLQVVETSRESGKDVSKRHDVLHGFTHALQSKLDHFQSQFTDNVTPLHMGVINVNKRVDEMNGKKLDISAAVTTADVATAVSRAIEHTDRRSDNLIKSIGAFESRIEQLSDDKANKEDVVMSLDLEALLTAHASEMDRHFQALTDDIKHSLSLKADKDEVSVSFTNLGLRVSSLEGGILKGLKGMSDRVAAALAEKLDSMRFNEFKAQVRAVLADVEDRLRDWSPAARGMKESGCSLGSSSCICCDGPVRSVKELQAMGFSSQGKPFVPDRLPSSDKLLPSICKSPDVGAFSNARVAQRKKDVAAQLLSKSAGNMSDMSDLLAPLGATAPVQDASVPGGPMHLGIFTPAMSPGLSIQGYDSKMPSPAGSKAPSRVSTVHSDTRPGAGHRISGLGVGEGTHDERRASHMGSIAEVTSRRGTPQTVHSTPRVKRTSDTGLSGWATGLPLPSASNALPESRPLSSTDISRVASAEKREKRMNEQSDTAPQPSTATPAAAAALAPPSASNQEAPAV